MRSLDARGVAYRAAEYDASGAFHNGEEAATLVGAPPEAVYKTLVVLREGSRGRPLLVMVPVAAQLDLRGLAAALGEKSLRMASQKEAEKLTGMQVGGISALGLRRPGAFEVLIDERSKGLERVHVSAGARGIDIELAVEDLVTTTGARWVRAVRE